MRTNTWLVGAALAAGALATGSNAQPAGKVEGSALVHTAESAIEVVDRGQLALPKAATGGADYFGSWKARPAGSGVRVPAVLFLHGSSGLKLAAIADPSLAARLVFAWSCEDNYFVEAHRTETIADQPFLNVISSVDPFFSRSNAWLGNPQASGHCAAALGAARRAAIVLIPGAPHTLINLPQVRALTRGFLEAAVRP